MAIHVKITASSSSATARNPKYVSPATNGVLVQVYTSPRASNPTVIGASATDVSPGSTACGGATGTRTCTIYIPAPAGTDDFVFTTYDQPPTAGTTTFPAGANILAIGVVTQTISLGGTNVVNVALGGVIASLSVVPLAASALPGSASSYNLAISGTDADGNTIIAGAIDPYYNPITVAVSEVGSSGSTSVSLNGSAGPGSASVQVSMSSQTATVLYTGGGTSGYGAKIAVSAQGASTVNATFGPFFVTSSSSYYGAASATAAFTAPGQTAAFSLSEYGFSGTFTATAGGSCANIASVSTPAPGTPSTATITAGSNSGSCTVTFSDGNVSFPVTVSNNYTSSTITIPAGTGTITSYANGFSASPNFQAITLGPDGNMWFVENGRQKVGKITPSGVVTEYPLSGYPAYDNGPYSIVAGADGQLWFGGQYVIGAITTSGTPTYYTIPTSSGLAQGMTRGAGNDIWFTEYLASKIGRSQAGTITEFTLAGNLSPTGIAYGPDGNIYFVDPSDELIGIMTPTGSLTTISRPGAGLYCIVRGPDGNMWFCEGNFQRIASLTPGTNAITEHQLTGVGHAPDAITVGSDGALWFLDGQAHIGRITTSGVDTYFTAPGADALDTAIAAGQTGFVWWTDLGDAAIDKIQL